MKNELKDLSGRRIFFVSDCHFFHSKIIEYCHRPFSSSYEMNETIFNNWNETVSDDDIIFHLGDFVCGVQNKNEMARLVEENLNGIKYFLIGNHDTKDLIPNKMINDKVYYIMYNGLKIALSHYPSIGEKSITFEGDLLLSGHVHNHSREVYNSFNCSVENINYTPILIDDIIKKLIERNS